MRETTALARWFEDRDAQEHAVRRSMDLRGAWRNKSTWQLLARRLDDAAGDIAAVAAIAAEIVTDVSLANDYVRTMMAGLSDDPFVVQPLPPLKLAIGTGVRLFEHPDLTVSLVIVDPDSLALKKRAGPQGRVIIFSGQLALRYVLRAGGAVIQRFSAEPAAADLSLATRGPCLIEPPEALIEGRAFVIDGHRESFTVLVAGSAIMWLECEVHAGRSPFRVEHDAISLRPVAASSTDLTASRMQLMLSTLRALGSSEVTKHCEGLLEHSSFDLRWHAMREMLLADPDRAWPHLDRLAHTDEHPEIRAAAAGAIAAAAAPGEQPCHA